MSDEQNESNQDYNNMSPKSGKDDKSNTAPSTIATETVEEDLNGKD